MPRTVKVVFGAVAIAALCAALAIGVMLVSRPTSDANSKDSGSKPNLKHYPNVTKVEDWQRHPETEALALAMDEKADYAQRLKAIQKLDNELRPKLVQDIVKTLKNREVNETVRNDLLAKLETQAKPLGTLGPLLVEMYRNKSDTWRWHNFCVQHAVPVWRLEPDHRAELVGFLFGILDDENGGSKESAVMYETSMLALSKIGASDPEVAGRIAKLASARLAEKDKDPERAVTAMQVAVGAGDKSILPDARKVAVDEKVLARLRMSAIAALGTMGEKADEALLEKLVSGADSRITVCAKNNLETLKKRLAK